MLRRIGLPALVLLALAFLWVSYLSCPAQAQTGGNARVLITQSVEEGQRITLSGNTRPEANSQNDIGPVANDFPMEHVLLQLRRSPQQEQALEEFINELHDPSSPNFHKWLTPQQFGQTYGLSQQDLGTITRWLQSFGFTVNMVYPSGVLIDFSGTAGEIEQAFHTAIHNLDVNGERHVANIREPQIPAALAPAVVGLVSLHDFRPRAMHKMRGNYTFVLDKQTELAVVPADLSTIYNLNPLFNEGINGQGQTVAVIEDTDVFSMNDWNTFRSTFGLSGYTTGSFTQVHPAPTGGGANCGSPGVNSDDLEAILDAEYASAAAPGAAIVLASCSDTKTTFGGLIAAQNLINGSTPPEIMSISYGECEAENGATANATYNSTFQQAVSEGISVFVSAGDEGAASCDADLSNATHGIGVSGFASTPYNVAVGGTDFGDTYAGTNSTYWNSGNTSTFGSAKSYIPEIPWNDSCASVLIATTEGYDTTYGLSSFCNSSNAQLNGWLSTTSGSGGPSGCATGTPSATGVVGGTCSGYAKPSWQTVIGNPSDGVRDIPDVSLFAANGVWGHYYIFCDSDTANGGAPCTGSPSGWSGAGGTSFASPILAGIQALVNQKMGGSQGNPNPVYYNLATAEYGPSGSSTCNSSIAGGAAGSCTFYDVTLGNMDINCTGSNTCYIPSGTYGVLSTSDTSYAAAYGTTTGWDFATGIGTLNAYNLVNNWPVSGVPNYTLSASPSSVAIAQGSNGPTTITVNPQNGFNSSVSLSASGLPSGVTASFNPMSTTSASTLTFTASSTAAIGTTTVTVTGISGSSSHTTTVSLTVQPILQSLSLNPIAVTGGTSSTGTVILSGAAPSGGALVTLSSSVPTVATVPGSVTVLAGATTATFTVTTHAVIVATPVAISGTYNGGTPQSATLTVNPTVSGGVAFVRSAGNSGESVKYTVSIAPVAGDFLGVFVWQIEGAATPSAMTDNLGSVYTKDCDLTFNQGSGVRRLTVYHLLNVPNGITSVNVTPNKPSRSIVAEYSGMPTTGTILDVCGTVNNQTSAVTSWMSTATATTANDLVFGLADTKSTGNAGYSASGAWIGRMAQADTVDADDSYLEDQIGVAAGSYTATGKSTASVDESSVVVAFKASTGPVAPAITSANSATFTVGAAGTFTVTATGSPVPTFTETGVLPSGVALSAAGVLSGTPAAGTAGNYPITISAQNGVGSNATQNFTLTVNPAPIAPTITSVNNTTFTVGTAGTFSVTATGTPVPTFTEAGTMPGGVSLSAAGVLSGTPVAGTGGTYTITITAQNGVAPNATQSFTLTIDQALAITSANNTTFTVGTAGSFTVTATGFPAPALSEAGALPTGVTFTATTGKLSGTPAVGTTGSYPITFIAQNTNGGNATQSFTLIVNAAVSGSVAFVRSAGNSGESVKYTVSIAPVAGDFLGVFVWQIEGAATPSAMTDNLGSVYTKDCDLTFNQGSGVRRLTVYHLLNVPNGITSVNVTPNKPSRSIVAEYSGMPTTGTILDVCGTVNNQTSAVTSWMSTATATTANDLVFGLADTKSTGNAGYSASGAWIGRMAQADTVDADDSYLEDQIGVAAGSYTATGKSTASVDESSVVVAFKTGH